MCVCIYTHTHALTHIYKCVCIYIYTHTRTRTHTHIYLYICVCKQTRACGSKMPTRCNRGFYCRSYCLLPVVFRAVVFKLLVWCGVEGYVSGLQDGKGFNENMLIKLDENSPNYLKVALWKKALTRTRTHTHMYNCMHGNDTYTVQNTCTPNVRPGYHCELCTDDRSSILGATVPRSVLGLMHPPA